MAEASGRVTITLGRGGQVSYLLIRVLFCFQFNLINNNFFLFFYFLFEILVEWRNYCFCLFGFGENEEKK